MYDMPLLPLRIQGDVHRRRMLLTIAWLDDTLLCLVFSSNINCSANSFDVWGKISTLLDNSDTAGLRWHIVRLIHDWSESRFVSAINIAYSHIIEKRYWIYDYFLKSKEETLAWQVMDQTVHLTLKYRIYTVGITAHWSCSHPIMARCCPNVLK